MERATSALTRRVMCRKAMLAPWDARVSDVWLYSLAKASSDHEVDVNHTVLAVNHQHSVVTPRGETLPKFMHAAHHKTSCALNALLVACGMDSPGQIWDGRQPHLMRLLDAEAQITQLVYQQVQNVTSGLVDRPEEMPGFVFDWKLWLPGRALLVHRPDVYFAARNHPEALELRFPPPPLLVETFGGNIGKLAYHMEKLTEHACEAICAARSRPARGAAAALAIHPFDEPRTMRERGGHVPTFRIGARGIVGRQLRDAASLGARGWRGGYGDSMGRWRAGDRDVVFPYGTYEMARLHGVNVADAPVPGCILTAPGTLLDEEWLEAARGAVDMVDVVANSRNALIDEAATLVDELDFAQVRTSSAASRSVREPPVVVQTLNGPRQTDPDRRPRRIVVLRQRPPSSARPRGADPPCE